ncbi:ATP-binding protein [Albimonas pacifica]|uniref:Predicted ATPase n=1 Tax=Albimonas pacifica TaxID=1114924 RepID=A0A1I3CVF5_9RHOB|nr:winged helix-turn-helix domain-containing protein [Albimonas pacifica]SFH78356.1 Predicted ATPase [Albimonas pacifica]
MPSRDDQSPDETAAGAARDALERPQYVFGPFRLVPRQRLLLGGEGPAPIGSRAFDILTLLAARAGEVVSKEELLRHAWPNTFVEDDNLRVHVAALRRVLSAAAPGMTFIATEIGRGYRFVAPVRVAPPDEPPATHTPPNLPSDLGVIGRADDIAAVARHLTRARLVTIVGAGGVGKTTVAAAAARRAAALGQPVAFVDFSTVGDPQLAPVAIAAALGAATYPNALDAAVAALRHRPGLLLLDGCEHLAHAVAVAADRLYRQVPDARILATSRAPLGLAQEHVFRLEPLASPAPGAALRPQDALAFSAVELFVTRANERNGYAFAADDAPVVADICRLLDGIPLAIELAAARAIALDLPTIRASVAESLSLLAHGPRSAPLRQQTMTATLDWSYSLLSDAEARILRSVSVFAGYFSSDDAIAVAADAQLSPADVAAGIAGLTAKSLVASSVRDGALRHRLLESTRVYATGRLETAGEDRDCARRHARHLLVVFEQAEEEWNSRPTRDWSASYAARIDDLRKALGWAFAPEGDAELGLRLTSAAIPLWDALSLAGESRSHVARALTVFESGACRDGAIEAKLRASHAWGLTLEETLAPEIEGAWERCIDLARRNGNADIQLRAFWGLIYHLIYTGRPAEAFPPLDGFAEVAAREDAAALPDGERLRALAEFQTGDLHAAHRRIEALARADQPASPRVKLGRFHFDRTVAIHSTHSLTLWLMGFPDRAARAAAHSVDTALSIDHGVSVSNSLVASALLVALWRGAVDEADDYLALLGDTVRRTDIWIWRPLARTLAAWAVTERGGTEAIDALRASIADLEKARFLIRVPFYRSVLAEALAASGDLVEAQATIAAAEAGVAAQREAWCRPEVLRVAGVVRMRSGDRDGAAALFARAMADAEAMGARSWQLRIAIAMTELDPRSGGLDRLDRCCRRFDEGFSTRDLSRARALLAGTGSGARDAGS